MNIKDTITAMESKLSEVDSLLDSYIEAEQAGERFKAHGITKDAGKIADEILKLAKEMDDSDLEEIFQEEEQFVIDNTIEFLTDKSAALQTLVTEYTAACQDKNEILARRLLGDIQKVGIEIAHVTDIVTLEE